MTRREEEPVKRAKNMPVMGRRSVGRQQIRWMDVMKRDMDEMGLGEEDAGNRNEWIRLT